MFCRDNKVLCCDIISNASLYSLSRYNFRCRENVSLPSTLSFVAKELSSVVTFQLSDVLVVS